MSDDTLNLILQRLDGIERGQIERFWQIDLSLGQIDQRFGQIDQRFEQIDLRFGQIDLRFGQIDQRFDRIEREQTRLRTDLVNQMERVLAEIQNLKDDMTVAMDYAERADASSDTTAALQRTMQSQLSHLRNRIERLEGRLGETG